MATKVYQVSVSWDDGGFERFANLMVEGVIENRQVAVLNKVISGQWDYKDNKEKMSTEIIYQLNARLHGDINFMIELEEKFYEEFKADPGQPEDPMDAHHRKIDAAQIPPGEFVEITAGPHIGKWGKVVRFVPTSESNQGPSYYVIDVGEYKSPEVPEIYIRKVETDIEVEAKYVVRRDNFEGGEVESTPVSEFDERPSAERSLRRRHNKDLPSGYSIHDEPGKARRLRQPVKATQETKILSELSRRDRFMLGPFPPLPGNRNQFHPWTVEDILPVGDIYVAVQDVTYRRDQFNGDEIVQKLTPKVESSMKKNAALDGLTRVGHMITVDGNLIPSSVVEASEVPQNEENCLFDLPEEAVPSDAKDAAKPASAEIRNATAAKSAPDTDFNVRDLAEAVKDKLGLIDPRVVRVDLHNEHATVLGRRRIPGWSKMGGVSLKKLFYTRISPTSHYFAVDAAIRLEEGGYPHRQNISGHSFEELQSNLVAWAAPILAPNPRTPKGPEPLVGLSHTKVASAAPVVVRQIQEPREEWSCPHCCKAILEKSLYSPDNGKTMFHRGCKEPIELPTRGD